MHPCREFYWNREKKKKARKNVGMIKPNETAALTSRGGGGAGAVSLGVKVKVS